MPKSNIIFVTLIGASMLFAGNSYASDETHGENYQALLATTQISLSQAIAAAESHLQGRAIHAALVEDHKGTKYEVEVIKGKQAMDVTVDPVNAKIVSSQPDHADENDEDEERNDD